MRVLLACLLCSLAMGAERINHAGRILGPAPVVTAPLLFNTAAADAVLARMQVMPRDNPWNEDVSNLSPLSNSGTMIGNIRSDVVAGGSNRFKLEAMLDMNFALVPDDQPRVDIHFTVYPLESDDIKSGTTDIGTYPLASLLPVEGWPFSTPGLSLNDWQTDRYNTGGDRHSSTVMPGAGLLWDVYKTRLTTGTPAWTGSNGARFDLASNALRPAGWTSSDAAGLPLFPSIVRYDEVQRGTVEHAMRLVVARSRQSYLYPATHQAGSTMDVNVPAMGERLRLKSSFVIPATWSAAEQAVAVALKKYGCLVADNGGFFSISITPDDRWPAGCWDHFNHNAASDYLDITNFEVVQATGPTGGPRSAGAPTANAGPDQIVVLGTAVTMSGSTTGSGLTRLWYPYPGAPGSVSFGNASLLNTTVSFGAIGTYTLMLKVSDGVHTPAYDALVVTVRPVGSDITPPVISAVAVGGITATSASITWSTDEAADSQVEYGITAGYGSSTALLAGLSTAHSQALSGLTPATIYHFRVRSADATGNIAYSPDLTFTSGAAPIGGGGGGSASAGGGGGGCGAGGAVGLLALLTWTIGLRRRQRR